MEHRNVLTLVFSFIIILGLFLGVISSDTQPPDEEATYVGWQTCVDAGCHAEKSGNGNIYQGVDEFRKTMHANIHNRPTPENVIIDRWFERDTTLRFYDFRVPDVPESPRDTFYIDLSKRGRPDEYYIRMYTTGKYADTTDWFEVQYNYGGNGWLQRFLVEVDGSYYPVPFQYVLKSYRDTENISDKVYFLDLFRWYSYDSQIGAIVFHERGTEEFLSKSWDRDCAACHVNGFDVEGIAINDSTTRWSAKWVGSDGDDSAVKDINIAVGCESCHGPGSNHADEPGNEEYQKILSPRRWDLSEESRFWTDRKLDLCNQCHNRHKSKPKRPGDEPIHGYQYDEENNLPYKPRLELRDFVSDTVKEGQYWGETKISYAHHQQGQDYWRSAHYKGHVFHDGCFNCHSVHNQTEYPYQLDRNWYSLRKGEGCVAFGCHSSLADTAIQDGLEYNKHTKHLNQHSQCVNCHYTKTATITFTGSYEFSDHSDKVIRPTATSSSTNAFLGVLNTCAASCHRNGYGERNRPDAFDRNASIRYSMGDTVVPMKAPDYGIVDKNFTLWKENTDLELADSLWEGYKRLYPEYVMSVREGSVRSSTAGITRLFPNPATEVITIRFDVQRRENVRIEVYDATGRILRIVSEGILEPGSYRDEWELDDELYNPLPGGVYYMRIIGESFSGSLPVLVHR